MPADDAARHLEMRIRECVACGYSLEGLPQDSACPECGRVFAGDEMCVAGMSPIMLFTPLGCAWAYTVPLILVLPILVLIREYAMALLIAVIGAGSVGGLLYWRRDLSRAPLRIVGGPHLLLLRDELRIRHGASNALTCRWEDLGQILLRQELPGLWRLTFRLNSMLLKPKFYFRGHREQAEALRSLIETRAAKARKR